MLVPSGSKYPLRRVPLAGNSLHLFAEIRRILKWQGTNSQNPMISKDVGQLHIGPRLARDIRADYVLLLVTRHRIGRDYSAARGRRPLGEIQGTDRPAPDQTVGLSGPRERVRKWAA